MTSAAKIKNWLLVIGNRVKVPGFEPLSEQTTNNLSMALQGANTFIPLDVALKLIPGSRVVVVSPTVTAGSFGHDKYFELPEGPPPDGMVCPENNVLDSYKILQDYARSALEKDQFGCDCTIIDECNEQIPYNSGGDCGFDEFESGLS
jgi:hypothetical protein